MGLLPPNQLLNKKFWDLRQFRETSCSVQFHLASAKQIPLAEGHLYQVHTEFQAVYLQTQNTQISLIFSACFHGSSFGPKSSPSQGYFSFLFFLSAFEHQFKAYVSYISMNQSWGNIPQMFSIVHQALTDRLSLSSALHYLFDSSASFRWETFLTIRCLKPGPMKWNRWPFTHWEWCLALLSCAVDKKAGIKQKQWRKESAAACVLWDNLQAVRFPTLVQNV